ncbi:MAG: SDR family NAD(P)-dependent oxidoreductase [Candidatus Acidiferrales bacterium]
MNRILITGGAGFIGSHTADRMLERGYAVRVLDSLQPRVHRAGRPNYLPRAAEFIEGDVRDRGAWERALDGVDAVFHLAAYQDYMPDFSTFLNVNASSTALLYEIAVERRLPLQKVVLASSQSVYGEGRYLCAEHGVIYPGSRTTEQLERGEWEHVCPQCEKVLTPGALDESFANPHTAYGISKYALELLGLALGRRYGIPTVALRYSIVQGPRNSPHNAYSGVCRTFTQRLLHHNAPVVYEDGRQLRDYVHVQDVASAHVAVLENPAADFEVFNVGGQRGVTVVEVARLVTQACGENIEPIFRGEYRVGDTRHTISSSAKIGRLGWRPRVSVEQIVGEYVGWARQQQDLPDSTELAAAEMTARGVLRSAAVRV